MWAYVAHRSKFELDAVISDFTGGQITDANNVIYKDMLGTLATPGTDFQFSNHTIDSTVSMFIPAAGYCNGSDLHYVGDVANYWSSSCNEDCPDYAWSLYFNTHASTIIYDDERCGGFSVRPVV